MGLIILKGKNKDFSAIWDCNTQKYTVLHRGKEICKKYKLADVKPYTGNIVSTENV